jgi:hypothetical protein
MAKDINQRLSSLQSRRSGTDAPSLGKLSLDEQLNVISKGLITESWQKRATQQPHTRYALGAMQAVGADYTRISIETAERVGKQLKSKLTTAIDFRLQGSVPLDVHIRGVSDVDLLTLDDTFFTYATAGTRSIGGWYTSPTTKTSLGVLLALRADAERVLKAAYPAAKVDCSGGKAISLSGGSLARPVDVVPAHWWDTVQYQASGQEHDRGVTILNKKVPETINNLPFTHIKRVHDRDAMCLGGLKKAIRLTKNVKNDADNETSAAKLPSFDIAALLYHADQAALTYGYTYELAILQETQRFLDWCYCNQSASKLLRTPDGSRFILDTEAKMSGLLTISSEMDKLAAAVAKEQLGLAQWTEVERSRVNDALRKAYIPAAA